jgi:hypothetical protein
MIRYGFHDDIHWSPGMEEAWETIKKTPKVTVTIDTFQWGLFVLGMNNQRNIYHKSLI